MNIVELLREKTNEIVTIEKYDLADLASSHDIRFLVDNSADIYEYYESNKLLTLENAEQFYDYLYLEYILKFEDHVEFIPEEYAKPLQELIQFSKDCLSSINVRDKIICLRDSYASIFKLASRLTDMGLMKGTLELMAKYNSGLHSSGIFECLVNEYTYFAFDNIEVLIDILKRNKGELLHLLLVENFYNIVEIRFSDICAVIKKLSNSNSKDISRACGKKVFDCIIERYNKHDDMFSLQHDLEAAYDALYQLKMEEAKVLISIMREIDAAVNKWLVEKGQKFEYELTIEPYIKWIEDRNGAPPPYRYLTISHEYRKGEFWTPLLERAAESYKPSFTDLVVSSRNSNDYFTLSKKTHYDIHITQYAMKLLYWFSSEELVNEFEESLQVTVESIFEILDYDIRHEKLDSNINDLTHVLYTAISNKERGINLYGKMMYVVSFLEKVLRLVYISIDKDIFFIKNVTLGAIFGVDRAINPKTLTLLGECHLRWTRYYLLRDEDGVGLEYRNRLAHLRDINPSSVEMFELLKISWIVLSTVNTILVNLINSDVISAVRD